jgi:uncharacterized protein
MNFEWFEEKRLWTLKDRGLDFRDFRDVRHMFDGRALYTYPSPRDGEARFVSVGLLEQRLIAVVWMERESARRIISIRRARHDEERAYRTLFG